MAGETRERILTVANELFSELGYEATSLRQIADRLGFTKAALYYHFQSKEQIMAALLAPADELLANLLERLEAAEDIREWAEALTWVVDQVFDHLDLFALIERNRTAIESLDALGIMKDHQQLHIRVEAAVSAVSDDLRDRVRMVAALGAVTGFDDWAPRLLAESDGDVLRRELVAAVHDVLGVPQARKATRKARVAALR